MPGERIQFEVLSNQEMQHISDRLDKSLDINPCWSISLASGCVYWYAKDYTAWDYYGKLIAIDSNRYGSMSLNHLHRQGFETSLTNALSAKSRGVLFIAHLVRTTVCVSVCEQHATLLQTFRNLHEQRMRELHRKECNTDSTSETSVLFAAFAGFSFHAPPDPVPRPASAWR